MPPLTQHSLEIFASQGCFRLNLLRGLSDAAPDPEDLPQLLQWKFEPRYSEDSYSEIRSLDYCDKTVNYVCATFC